MATSASSRVREDAPRVQHRVPDQADVASAPQPSFTPGRFAGKTAIVTGAGSGIGRATALRLAREGARVVAADISGDRLEQLAAEIPDLDLVPVAGDIATEDGVQAVVAAAGGRVDALANVAGIMDAFLPPAEVDDATWERVFAVNVTAVMRLTRAVLPIMLAGGGGSIVNVSSEASLRASASGVAYTASKHAVNGSPRAPRSSTRQRDPCQRRRPRSGGHQHRGALQVRACRRRAGTHHADHDSPVATAEQLAATITWLLSDDASNVNGTILPSDGGWSAI